MNPTNPVNLGQCVMTNTESMIAAVEYRDGIMFKLRYISRHTLSKLSQSCLIWKFNDKTRVRQQQLDTERFAEEFCKKSVVGWEGVTPRKLASLMPLDLTKVPVEQQDAEMPFDLANLLVMLKHAYDLDTFLQDNAVDIKVFRPGVEEELGNLPSSQTGT